MDSRLIHKFDEVHHPQVVWTRKDASAESEWVYCGLGPDLNREVIMNAVEQQFHFEAVYLKQERNNSMVLTIPELLSKLETYIGQDFCVWDSKFENVIEFNEVGVFRVGRRP